MSDKEPWSRIREWKEKKHAKDQAREERAVLGPNAPPQPQESFDARFKVGVFREKLLFGAIVGGVTGSFFGGLDAFQGMKKEQAFGIPLKTTQAKMKFAGQIVGSSALVFSGFYSAYHGVKYLSRVARDEDDVSNAFFASIFTVAPMFASATFRRNTTYAMLLIAMDVIGDMGDSGPEKKTT